METITNILIQCEQAGIHARADLTNRDSSVDKQDRVKFKQGIPTYVAESGSVLVVSICLHLSSVVIFDDPPT